MKQIEQTIRVLLFVALICLPSVVAAQERFARGESTITGRVIFADTGKPVRRAAVRLFSNLNHPAERMTTSNARGEFRFNEVAAGAYFVLADAPGGFFPQATFAITEFGISSDAEMEHTRVSVDGKGATRCEVRVVRGGTIMGTIVYTDKEPVTGAQIVLFRRRNGATSPLYTEPVHTNDRGMYRFDGLPEGEYFIGVLDSRRRLNIQKRSETRSVVTAYYPGVTSIAEAKPIQVQSGSEVSAINITLGEDGLRQISGVVKWREDGKPAAGATLILRRTDEPKVQASFDKFVESVNKPGGNKDDTMFRDLGLLMMTIPPKTETGPDGEWKFEDLPPGKYVLSVYASLAEKRSGMSELDMDADARIAYAARMVERKLELTIDGEDLKDIAVEMSEGGRISGMVVGENAPLQRVSISIVRPGAEIYDELGSYHSTENGSFVVEGVGGGDVRLDVTIPFTDDLYVKSITLGSQDLMRNPVRVEDGREIAGVRITLAKGLATLTGRALFKEDGSLAAASGVLLVRADPALWQLSDARAFTTTNPDGEFVLKCPPGDYLVFTWAAGNQPLQSIQEFVRANAASARRIVLQSREEKRIELTVVKSK